MNQIRESLPKSVKDFFNKLSQYLDTELYFYGSINRSDYIHGKSDIDIAIFTDNENSTIAQLQHFLHVKRDAFDKVVWKLNGKMIYGYKIKCEKNIDIKCEIAIYNNDYKGILLDEFKTYNYVPFHLAILLFLLKTLHYTLPLISKKTYMSYKVYIFNKLLLNKKDTVFFVIKNKNINS
jgi:predicted nucleotidyltransferase